MEFSDRVVVVGSGLAGLATALSLAPLPVLLVTEGRLGRLGSTSWAQGGIASALADGDLPAYHEKDTLVAGAGLSDRDAVQRVVAFAPDAIDQLRNWGVTFDTAADGSPVFALEGAHSRARVLHARGDRTGSALVEALLPYVESASHIEVVEDAVVTSLTIDGDVVRGVWIQRSDDVSLAPARAVVLATGGLGGLYASTTNPLASWGSGLRLAAHAGARLRDIEFVQFHPTAIDLPYAITKGAPLPLASEAIRGEGGVLVDDTGALIMAADAGGDLGSRDKVAQTIAAQRRAGRRTFLDCREAIGAAFPKRFPGVTAHCHRFGIDPVTQPIPVRPAAHYHMGGIETGLSGGTSLEGLWAVGEVASTGMHGANRLASNSLLEAVAFACFAARDIRARPRTPKIVRSPSNVSWGRPPILRRGNAASHMDLRDLMDMHVGVARDRAGLSLALQALASLRRRVEPGSEISGMAEVAGLITLAALSRHRTIGAHVRSDDTADGLAKPLHQSIFAASEDTARLIHEWSE